MFKGALFDLDGVITDTSILHFEAWRKLVDTFFSSELPDSLEEKTKGVSRTDSLKVILKHLDVSVSETMFQQLLVEKNAYYKEALQGISSEAILPGVSDFISELKQQQVRLALASASLNGPFILDKLDLRDSFDAIVDPRSVARGKPAPDIFLAAAAALKLKPSKCIGIEDSIAGLRAIKDSGAFSVAVGKTTELQKADLTLSTTAELKLTTICKAYFH
ncbi:beta-phosphoglucomutase [Enterococcus florum]|uniref:Beta-phosphoglucomutase n=1 Tax=Enterococcus florum TaxID=2480627 RepID=A0A4P5P9Z5_9ENTE|nr:beta-phosphoglucomutase [Enterococcus florum]GCF94436.1 beta-phosphoglucomutase [Enterococcus florum]